MLGIATAYGLAMRWLGGGWSRFAGSAVVAPGPTAERSMPVPYITNPKCVKNPPVPKKRGISIKIVRIPYAERILATGREVYSTEI